LATSKSKAKLLDAIRVHHQKLEEVMAGVPEDAALKPRTVGEWSVKDTIAHVTAWEKYLLKWYQDGAADKKFKLPDWRVKGTLRDINQKIFEANLNRSLDDVMADFKATYQKILATIGSIPEEDIFARGRYAWTGERTLYNYIQANTVRHYSDHAGAIARMKK
jgi:hypothetical protein